MNEASRATLAWFQAEPLGLLLIAVLVLLAVQTFRLYASQNRASWRVAEHRRAGEAGERIAKTLLTKSGYRILREQASTSYPLYVDGERLSIRLRADFYVEKGRRTFIAEVKSGVESAKLTGRATRRQLLEYSLAFSVDGLLLVDVADGSIRTVEFPKRSADSSARTT